MNEIIALIVIAAVVAIWIRLGHILARLEALEAWAEYEADYDYEPDRNLEDVNYEAIDEAQRRANEWAAEQAAQK